VVARGLAAVDEDLVGEVREALVGQQALDRRAAVRIAGARPCQRVVVVGHEGAERPDLVVDRRGDAVEDRGPVPEPPGVDRPVPDALPGPDVLARRRHQARPLVDEAGAGVRGVLAQVAIEVAGVGQVRLVPERDAGDLAATRVVSEDRRDAVPDERDGMIDAAPGKPRCRRRHRGSQYGHPVRQPSLARIDTVQRRADPRQVVRRDELVAVGSRRVERHLVLRASADAQKAGAEVLQQIRESGPRVGAHVAIDQRPLDADADEMSRDVPAAQAAWIDSDAGINPCAVRRGALLVRR
jgi:hypothetical protein